MIGERCPQQVSVEALARRRRPGFSLEQPFYLSPEVFAHDLERVFLRHWLLVGHGSRLPNAGDYFLYRIGQESVILVRDASGQIHALSNVCRHRGSRLCRDEQGPLKKFVCPYHAWTYDLDGTLLAARHMPEGFDKAAFGLQRGHVRLIEGLIFCCLTPDPPAFTTATSDLTEFLKPQGLDHAKICRRRSHLIEANWKLVAENFYECYHCTHTHPEFCSVMSYAQAMNSDRLARERADWERQWEAHARQLGHKVGRVQRYARNSLHQGGRVPIRPGYLTQSQDGQPVAPLLGDGTQFDGGITSFMIYPLSWLVVCNDHAMLARFTPLGPTQTEIELTWLVRADAVEGRDYDPDRVAWLWTVTVEQDKVLCENNQAGVSSCFYQPGPYAQAESGVEEFLVWYLKQITGAE